VSGRVARGTAVLGHEHRSTLASSVVAWTIDPLGRRSGAEHRSTEASSAVASNGPLAKSVGRCRRLASIDPSRYHIPGITAGGEEGGKGIWGKGMGAKGNSIRLPSPIETAAALPSALLAALLIAAASAERLRDDRRWDGRWSPADPIGILETIGGPALADLGYRVSGAVYRRSS
jgi:hypothetical protein